MPQLPTIKIVLLMLVFIGSTQAMASSVKRYDSPEMVADLFHDPQRPKQKPIILLPGSEGQASWSYNRTLIQRLVDEEFAVLSLAYYRTNNLPRQLARIPIEYINHAIGFMQQLTGQKEVTLMGVSRGGELALLTASLNPDVTAVIALVPSAWAVPGYDPIRQRGLPYSGWTYQGQEIPYIRWRGMRLLEAVAQTPEHEREAARIKVENINGPVLCLSGRKDLIWDSEAMCTVISDKLAGSSHAHRHEVIDGHGHGIIASPQTWEHVFDFLHAHRR